MDEIEDLVAKYTHGLPPAKTRTIDYPSSPPVVLLTGATGNIGSHILAHLLSVGAIEQVYTIDRHSLDPRARLRTAFMDRSLSPDLLDEKKLVCLTGDVEVMRFGMEERTYNEVTSITLLLPYQSRC